MHSPNPSDGTTAKIKNRANGTPVVGSMPNQSDDQLVLDGDDRKLLKFCVSELEAMLRRID